MPDGIIHISIDNYSPSPWTLKTFV